LCSNEHLPCTTSSWESGRQKFANLRLLLAYMWAQPGKKLLFMGGEIGQWREWHHDESLDWHLLQYAPHEGVRRLVSDINRVYRSEPALHERDCDPAGFEWVDCADWQTSALSFLRKGKGSDAVLVVCNFTPVPRVGYRIGVPFEGTWREIVNTDGQEYGGSGMGNLGGVVAEAVPTHGRPFSLNLVMPPLAAVFLKGDGPRP
jgi:1,4-alpha-glucan branching enzyme